MKKDTLRVLVSWECNLRCSYCCNNQERFRKDIHPKTLDEIAWGDYSVFCITGGEPLLNLPKLQQVLSRCDQSKMIVLYTNGLLLDAETAKFLQNNGVKAINVGLHLFNSFDFIIQRVLKATAGTGLSVRFHAQDIHQKNLEQRFPGVIFRFWKMDDCDRGNEDRVILA